MATSTAPGTLGERAPSLPLSFLAAPLTWRAATATVALLLAIVAATNRWMSWGAGLVYARADDEHAYLLIARAAPGMPGERIAPQHADRWPLHWLMGWVADLTGAQVEILYRYAAIALAIAVLLALAGVLMRVGASTATALLCLGVVALNPYALRYYALAPGYLTDLGLELGIALSLLGVVTRRLPLVLAGALLGAVCRQTMLPLLPVLALWVAYAPQWRDDDGGRARLGRAGAVLALPIVVYGVVGAAAQDFSRPTVAFSQLTILEHTTKLPGTASDLVNHFAHVGIVLLAIGGLLIATLLSTGLRNLPFAFWGSLTIGLVVVAQAAALNPDPVFNDYSSSNEPRLTAMGLGALAVALAIARGAAERAEPARQAAAPALALVALGLLTIASLHQDLTIISTGSSGVTLALQTVVALALFAAVLHADRRAPTRRLSRRPA